MMNLTSEKTGFPFLNSEEFLKHWQGHRKVTRRVIDAFPADKLFEYAIGGMRPFAAMAHEIMSMSSAGVKGIATGQWTQEAGLDHHTGKNLADSKQALLAQWDKVTADIDTFWPQIPPAKFREIILAFGQYEGEAYGIIQYFVDNEIHHRAQGTVYLRSLGIEPPAFWDRD